MAGNASMTTRQIFNLRWNNHTNNMLQVFLEQLADERLVDITLSCEGRFLKVHKIVLSACSPYFQELFSCHNEQNPIVILNGVKYADLRAVVNFMYCGEIEVAEPEMEGVLAVAEALKVKGLSNVRDSYENQHQKMSGSEDEGEPTGRQSKRKTHASPRKKRKLGERSQQVNYSTGKEASGSQMTFLAEEVHQPMTASAGEFNQDLLKDTVVKEEILDLDAEVNSSCKTEEVIHWNMEKGTEKTSSYPVITVHDVENKSMDQTDGNSIFHQEEVSLPLCKPQSILPRIEPEVVGLREPLQIVVQGIPMLSSSVSSQCPTVTFSDERSQDKIPRPPNAFMVFANEWRRKLAELHHGETNKEISVRLGVMWKKLEPEAKESYFAAARRADAEHKLRYPGYTYSPKEARLRKILRRVTQRHGASRLPLNPQASCSNVSGFIELPEHCLGTKGKH